MSAVGSGAPRPIVPPGLILFAAVAAMSWAGPLIRLATAPALVISAWRLMMSVAIIAGVLALRRGGGGVRLGARDWALAAASGLLLALHLWSWIASLDLTSVASSVVLVNTHPILVASLSALLLRERASAVQWVGIGIAVVGAAVIGWGDFHRGASPLVGDVLALAGAGFVSGYFIIGRTLRQRLELWVYIGIVYGIAALTLALAVLVMPGVHLTGWPTRDWLIFVALAAGPMMIGHTGVNYALRFVPAYVANITLLGEPVGSALIAWLLPQIGERPPAQTLMGGALILLGIALGVRRGGAREARRTAEATTVADATAPEPAGPR